MSGAMVTEYAAQVAAVATPSRSPQTSVRTPPAPAATSATALQILEIQDAVVDLARRDNLTNGPNPMAWRPPRP
jgi:hypothetical protein